MNKPVAWMRESDKAVCSNGEKLWFIEEEGSDWNYIIPLYTHPHPDNLGLALSIIDQQKLEIETLKAEIVAIEKNTDYWADKANWIKNNKPVAWKTNGREVMRLDNDDDTLHTHPVKELTDEEIMEIFKTYEEMQEYEYIGKKPFSVHLGWSLEDRSQCLMLARAILRKAQEK